ncbi:hypothetical protein A9995_11675 [Erythrobacter sp. QSSC1-22B]|nr:hypothetical protein A9995_11675 [Erythrobacter sp. QSSC1-22B]
MKNILLRPTAEWERIEREPASIGGLYMRYVGPLAAIPPLATLIGTLAFGYPGFLGTYRPTFLEAVVSALVQYGLTLVGVFVLALVINALAPRFDARPDKVQAFKVAAYSATAAWVAGIFSLLPALSILSILSLYSLYLLYLGLPRLMQAPREKALSYTGVVVLAMLVAGFVIGAISAPIAGQLGGAAGPGGGFASAIEDGDGTGAPGTIALPGGGSIDLGAMASSAEKGGAVEAALGGSPAAPLDQKFLASLLPETVAGLPMTERQNASLGTGIGSNAQVRYGSGNTSIELEIVDMSALGGMAAMAGTMGMESESETATGYERTGTVNGRLTIEKWDSASERGTYSVVVGNRAIVRAEGRGVDMQQMKSAVHGIDFSGIERAANGD